LGPLFKGKAEIWKAESRNYKSNAENAKSKAEIWKAESRNSNSK
jgi:molybdopterin synthase catalytic subunit